MRDNIALKVDQLDKYYNEEITKIETVIRNDKSDVKGEIVKSHEELSHYLTTEI